MTRGALYRDAAAAGGADQHRGRDLERIAKARDVLGLA
jgi:hypothetical protein